LCREEDIANHEHHPSGDVDLITKPNIVVEEGGGEEQAARDVHYIEEGEEEGEEGARRGGAGGGTGRHW